MRGIPAYTNIENMQFIELRDKNGKQIEVIGAPFEFENNQTALDCLDKAAENNQEVEISGNWESQGEGTYGFLNDTLHCKPVAQSSSASKAITTPQANPELRGPKIFGLQLGMYPAEVESVMRSLAAEKNLKFVNNINDATMPRMDIYQGQKQVVSAFFQQKNNHWLNKLYITAEIFGVNFLHTQEFLQQFSSHYGIPQFYTYKEPIYGAILYKYTDKSAGFEITISNVNVALDAIQKQGTATFR